MVIFYSYVSLPEGTSSDHPVSRCFFFYVVKTMSCLPPMTGNGKFIAPIAHKFMVMTGGWLMLMTLF